MIVTAFAGMKLLTYFLREEWSSFGLLMGVHTGSPTNRRIACQEGTGIAVRLTCQKIPMPKQPAAESVVVMAFMLRSRAVAVGASVIVHHEFEL